MPNLSVANPKRILFDLLPWRIVWVVIWAACRLADVNAEAGQARGSAPQTQPAIQVLAWMGPPAQVGPLREMADAGFTISFDSFADVDAAMTGLDAAKAAGVKLLVSCPQLKTEPAATAGRLKAHAALAGYFLIDEPAAASFTGLADWVRQVRAADPDHPAYINLFPNYATPQQLGDATYQKYLDDFIKTVPVALLSFDHYPVIQPPGGAATLRPQWYEDLEQASAAARQAKIPLWAFALSTRHFDYPTATLAHLRVQVFSDLAYGAQTIQYFTYWQVGGSSPPFADAPVGQDGKRTVVYDRVKQVNQEIRGLAEVFAGSQLVTVGHTGPAIPQGTRRYEAQSPIESINTDGPPGSGAVVSVLSKGQRRFLVLVNRDINAPLAVSVRLDDSLRAPTVRAVNKDGSSHALMGRIFQSKLEPGDVAVLAWTEQKSQQ